MNKSAEDPKKKRVFHITQGELDYLWECMPIWIKEGPGDRDKKRFCTWYGTLTHEGDLEVHNEVKRILHKK